MIQLDFIYCCLWHNFLWCSHRMTIFIIGSQYIHKQYNIQATSLKLDYQWQYIFKKKWLQNWRANKMLRIDFKMPKCFQSIVEWNSMVIVHCTAYIFISMACVFVLWCVDYKLFSIILKMNNVEQVGTEGFGRGNFQVLVSIKSAGNECIQWLKLNLNAFVKHTTFDLEWFKMCCWSYSRYQCHLTIDSSNILLTFILLFDD